MIWFGILFILGLVLEFLSPTDSDEALPKEEQYWNCH